MTDKRHQFNLTLYKEEILKGNRSFLGRAITLGESTLDRDRMYTQNLLLELLPHTGNSIRIGVSGIPGAGNSIKKLQSWQLIQAVNLVTEVFWETKPAWNF